MRTTRTRTALVAVAALPLLATLAMPAGAEPAAVHYKGSFTDLVADGCFTTGTSPAPYDVTWQPSGTWSVVSRGDMATVAFNIFLDGRHHVAFGGPLPQMQEQPQGALAAVQFPTGAGLLTVTVFEDEMTYAFGGDADQPGYAALDGSFTCESLTYVGSVR